MSHLIDSIGKGLENNAILYKKQDVRVYVENEDDVPFWKHIFNKFSIKTSITPVTNQKDEKGLERGKQNVLYFANQTNKDFVLCVDSDYDYLINGKSEPSKTIKENPFIFQTYTYSIENYKCYAESLHQVMVEATLVDEQLFDFELFMQKYSETIYELFLYSVYYDLQNQIENEQYKRIFETQKQNLSEAELQSWQRENAITHVFPTEQDFCEQIKILKQLHSFEEALAELENIALKVGKRQEYLPKIDETEFQIFKNELGLLGLTPQNTYLFMQGHTLYDNVVCMFIKNIFTKLKNEKLAEFGQLAKKDEELEVKRNEYLKYVMKDKYDTLSPIERTLQQHKYYVDCFLFKKIEQDVKHYLELVQNTLKTAI